MYCCKQCQTQVAAEEDIVSKDYYGKTGKAYLLNKVVNVTVGEKEERMLITGVYTIAGVSCINCKSVLGWKYEAAHEEAQKYKEGKYILEMSQVFIPGGSSH
ncbi:hypothetical protein IFM89_031590 [Coptis chinensis]|uniref:Protein yippee-like n=1 Tax=Coptis chinensis TaxID=261450 RepID=A0A835LJ84_9MAGN|nr:hypothetical protein IFM89_031590 [Coptis chinensis]